MAGVAPVGNGEQPSMIQHQTAQPRAADYFIDHYGVLRQRPQTEPVSRREGIHAVLIQSDRLLVVRPADADWLELPGGGIEPGETPAQALARELREEAGLDLGVDTLRWRVETHVQHRYFSSKNGAFWNYGQRYVLLLPEQDPAFGQPSEAGNAPLWIPLDSLNTHRIHHCHRSGIDRLLTSA